MVSCSQKLDELFAVSKQEEEGNKTRVLVPLSVVKRVAPLHILVDNFEATSTNPFSRQLVLLKN